MCCTRLAENTGRQNDAKNGRLRTIAQICRAVSLQLRHVSTIGRKLLNVFFRLSRKEKEEETGQKYNVRICSHGGHNKGFTYHLKTFCGQSMTPDYSEIYEI